MDKCNRPYQAGLSLFEQLVVLAILSTLLTLALSSYGEIFSEHRPEHGLKQIKRALVFARVRALSTGAQTTVCHLEHNRCVDNHWHESISVFVDRKEPNVLDKDDTLLLEIDAIPKQDKLAYPRRAVVFNYTGAIKGFTNGTFVYCLPEHEGEASGLEMSVSNSGRARIRDTDKCPL